MSTSKSITWEATPAQGLKVKEAPLEIRLRHVAVISSHTALLLHHIVSRW